MKKILSLILALVVTTTLWAYDFQSGDLYYNITSDTTVEVTYQRYWSCDNYENLKDIVIPENVTYNNVTYFVTSIGDNAFSHPCTPSSSQITSVIIPNNITIIREDAFYGCNFTSIVIPNGVKLIKHSAFSECSSLTSIIVETGNTTYDSRNNCNAIIETATNTLIAGCSNTIIPNSVTTIGSEAFHGTSITSFSIPSSVKSIEPHAFYFCESLTSITIPNSVTNIGAGAFDACSSLTSITIPNSVTSIGYSVFDRCPSLASIKVEEGNTIYDSRDNCNAIIETATNRLIVGCRNTIIPNSVTTIGDHAFSSCESLTSVIIPQSVTKIENYAFAWCYSLKSIIIPNGVASIGNYAFWYCSIDSIIIPNSVTSIGGHVFGHTSLSYITIPNSVTNIGENAFDGCTFTRNNFINNSSLNAEENKYWGATIYEENGLCIVDSVVVDCLESVTSVIIPDTIIAIGDDAFDGCSSLTSITIPNGVTSIGDDAFSYCRSLTSITIPNSVTSIGFDAFRYCRALTSITIPESVTSIGENAFEYCTFTRNNFINNSSLNAEENQYWGATIYEENGLCIVDSVVVDCLESATSVVIPDTIIAIGDYAFEECSSLASVTIPNSVKSIGEGAFFECVSLTSIMIPNSVINIGEIAFVYCSSLANMTVEIGNTIYDSRNNCNAIIETATNKLIAGCKNTTIPTNVTSIGMNAFYACPITSITIPNSVTTIGAGAFAECDLLKSLAIPRSVTTLGEAAFALCESLILLDIPNTVSRIGMDAFAETGIYNNKSNWDNGALYISNCLIEAQRDISGNYTVKKDTRLIADGAFYRCNSLHSITIPENVASVGELAFSRCSELNTVTCLATTPPILGKEAFLYCDDPVLFVLCESQADYQSHEQWRQFSSVQCIASEEVETDDVVINTGSTSVTITWPTDPNAENYVIVIKQGDKVFCTLTFNAEGQLLNIAFAPARDGNRPAQYAEQVADGSGYRFTVTGLEDGTDYTYEVVTKDEEDNTLSTYSGEFTTQRNIATDVENTDAQYPTSDIQKIMHNGQLIILRDGKTYTIMGAPIQ